jgi:predicted DCC family thiol-disulfide oxidoreductase YuxK
MAAPTPDRLVLYDGECGVCNQAVQLLLRLDPRKELYFAPLQGTTTTALRQRHPEIPTDLSTLVFVNRGRVYLRSRAAFALARGLPWPWRAAAGLRILPTLLTDMGYRFVAAIRYRLAGRVQSCRLATADEAKRFLP